jgi:hypothetical protein
VQKGVVHTPLTGNLLNDYHQRAPHRYCELILSVIGHMLPVNSYRAARFVEDLGAPESVAGWSRLPLWCRVARKNTTVHLVHLQILSCASQYSLFALVIPK